MSLDDGYMKDDDPGILHTSLLVLFVDFNRTMDEML